MLSTVRWPKFRPGFLGGRLGAASVVLTQVSVKNRREPGAPAQAKLERGTLKSGFRNLGWASPLPVWHSIASSVYAQCKLPEVGNDAIPESLLQLCDFPVLEDDGPSAAWAVHLPGDR